jgi:hypothetical protein
MEGLENFRDLKGNQINEFYNKYRDAMKESYDANVSAIEQQKRNDFQSIMSQANKRGMMYSNFPERQKIQYEADTYLPGLKAAYTSYQTGLDKLRSSALGAYNNAKDIEDQIAHLKNMSDASGNGNAQGYKWGRTGKVGNTTWFYDNNGKPVRFSTWARNNGYDASNSGYLQAAFEHLATNEYNALRKAFDAQANTDHPNLTHNANSFGGKYVENDYDYLDDGTMSLLNSLGLGFGQ